MSSLRLLVSILKNLKRKKIKISTNEKKMRDNTKVLPERIEKTLIPILTFSTTELAD